MATREEALHQFIEQNELSDVNWMEADASNRRYARVKKNGQTYVLMDSPLSEKPAEFAAVAELLTAHNLPAPKIYAKDMENGFLLLEDFGNLSLSQAVLDETKADALYEKAMDTLIQLQKRIKGQKFLPNALPVLRKEHALFLDYYVPEILKIELSEQAKAEFNALWDKLFKGMENLPHTLALYDYHLDNIMVKADGSLGILDFQDALWAPCFYDVMSLVEDERYPLPNEKRKIILKQYVDSFSEYRKISDWAAVIAAHRHTRVLGIFGRLAALYNKPDYLKYVPNDWTFLKENVQNPLLAEYKNWLETYLPEQIKAD